MRPLRHRERHFAGSDAVRDVILGMSDGLTTPFALAAGLAGAAPSSLLVVIGGLAEIARLCGARTSPPGTSTSAAARPRAYAADIDCRERV